MKVYIKSSSDKSGKWVIVDKDEGGKYQDNPYYNQLFIAPQKYESWYHPTYTSIGRRNYDRAKLFNSKEEAQAYIDKQNKEKELFVNMKGEADAIAILPYEEAMANIGDPEQNYKDYKQKQVDDRKAYRERHKGVEKARREKNKAKDPGRYKVWFYYANSWLGAESFIVDAESIDDAFKKAKAKALRQDEYRDTQGYDERMIFNKNNISKIG